MPRKSKSNGRARTGRSGPRAGGPRKAARGSGGPRKARPSPTKSKRLSSERSGPAQRKPVEPAIEGEEFRSGYVVLIGRPNVGKSTILNQVLGQKLAATTHKPQTTRKNLLGMLNPPGAQILLLDTPGYHQAKGPLNRYMVSQAEQAIHDADVLGYVIEGREDANITPGNERLIGLIKKVEKPCVLLINKIDRVKTKEALLHQIQTYQEALGDQMLAAVPISAKKKNGLERAVRELGLALPPGPRYFEGEEMTDAPERSIVSEFIREKAMLETREELPYSVAVTIESFEDQRPKIVRVFATLHVERDSQKGIVIGKRGERLKSIGARARQDIEHLLGSQVYLDLRVKVTESWSDDGKVMARLGYGGEADVEPMEVELASLNEEQLSVLRELIQEEQEEA